MGRRSASPTIEPSPKRARLDSSPLFDEEISLSVEEANALETFEENLTQLRASQLQARQYSDDAEDRHDEAPSDDPFSELPSKTPALFSTATSLFQSAAQLEASSSQDAFLSQPNINGESDPWFDAEAPTNVGAGFSSASSISLGFKTATTITPGFQTASKKGAIIPSAEALARAKARMREWQDNDDDDPAEPDTASPGSVPSGFPLFQTASSITDATPERSKFRNLVNVPETPTSPTRPAVSRPSVLPPSSQPFRMLKSSEPPPFRPPLLKTAQPKTPFTPPFAAPRLATPGPAATTSTFTSAAAVTTPARPFQRHGFTTPYARLEASPLPSGSHLATPLSRPKFSAARSTPAKFKTPFKAGMGPGTPGFKKLLTQQQSQAALAHTPGTSASTPRLASTKAERTFFDLTPPLGRKSLAVNAQLPRWHELNTGDLPNSIVTHLELMHPSRASEYSFYSASPGNDSTCVGPQQAYEQLQADGCTLATKEWVENHWGLILWKLAGMAHIEPEREWYDDKKRWGWEEVHRQLLYRYEREINRGQRPPLRCIVMQDVASVYPMVLCVSEINWSPLTRGEDGSVSEPAVELQVTDGWYKIRAQVDDPLTRAITKGTLRVGRKIAVVNAKLDSERKDGQEILKAEKSAKLVLCGNATHLAPWHAKLGFMKEYPIITMNSLTGDGGVVPSMDVVVQKVHPMGYCEFNTDGSRTLFDEKEEFKQQEKWTLAREVKHSKLKETFESDLRRYLTYAERLERKAGSGFRPNELGPPDSIEEFYDQLENASDSTQVLSSVGSSEAGWLALHIRAQIEQRSNSVVEEIEKELNETFPVRNVVSLRVLFVKDAYTERHDANREAAVTVWDALNTCLTEGRKPGTFVVGEKCRFTHLQPTSIKSWMGKEPGSQIFLRTTKATRIVKLKG
ncbi:hypothetical protein CYLTODRAFT_416868 [Cylindrobasidium torrendii FP15055 ss-10]|uniref:BRCA2 OB1 domain-containing protein n=1 Tax=Cylindrobasidium torrendii FP15055 ss-10 TaxID=1314674 RepID=A0A0D7BTJ2_9AGAR|nr:hypothetical protein CYLTODRAFT_416868 [Cylindrobasidium torrendii FP15055 ss-10]